MWFYVIFNGAIRLYFCVFLWFFIVFSLICSGQIPGNIVYYIAIKKTATSEEGGIGNESFGHDFCTGCPHLLYGGLMVSAWAGMKGMVATFPIVSSREEIAMIRNRLKDDGPWLPIGTSVRDLAGEYFLVTGSGKFFRDIKDDPEATLAIIKLDDKGENCRESMGTCSRVVVRPASCRAT